MDQNRQRYHVRTIALPLGGLMASIVDEEVLGLKERDEEKGLVIDVDAAFYAGDVMDESDAVRIMDEADVIILVGRRAVSLGIKAGYVNEDAVLRIGRLEYTQVFKIKHD